MVLHKQSSRDTLSFSWSSLDLATSTSWKSIEFPSEKPGRGRRRLPLSPPFEKYVNPTRVVNKTSLRRFFDLLEWPILYNAQERNFKTTSSETSSRSMQARNLLQQRPWTAHPEEPSRDHSHAWQSKLKLLGRRPRSRTWNRKHDSSNPRKRSKASNRRWSRPSARVWVA